MHPCFSSMHPCARKLFSGQTCAPMSFLLLWYAFAPMVLSLLLTSVIYFCNNGEEKEAQTSRGDGGEVPRAKKKSF